MVWISFFIIIIIILAIDLGVFNKTPHIISTKEATKWTVIWITVSFLFSGVIYWIYGNGYIENPDNLKPIGASIKYITGYLIELSLSIDNIFVIAIIFSAFKIPQKYQHRVLFWGILGAIFFRGLMIYFGVLIIHKFAWTTYIFGAFLIYTAAKMLWNGDEDQFDPKTSFVYKSLKKIIPISNHIDDEHFFVKRRHLTAATPLFVALVVIEVMDVVFAVDSVPAILAITNDPFLVFSSNIFAILGLRSMYFFLANMLEKFSYLEYSLIVILTFVGIKMIIQDFVEIPEWVSLAVIAVSLLSGVVFSLYKNKAD
ncbi:TerC family protein [Flavobacterium sp.]|uniref:TerC family protein n=1 Tax=Flavobacterium sp. TaxID=239 RepID=UPI00261DD610|nr:TerC family protein [Flavobacterium sp.]MDG2432400.1 TerC family protein [Flavobacterium sp.]